MLFKNFSPPPKWQIPVIILLGIFAGCGAYAFYVSKAWSYLSDDPSTCVNCHVMAPQYASWAHSSHFNRTSCVDCHIPHKNAVGTYIFKAKDGLRHSAIFTLRKEPQVIRIKEEGQEAVLDNCIRCHFNLVENTAHRPLNLGDPIRKCWECHRETPHGRQRSLSNAPYAQVPLPQSPVPKFIKQLSKEKSPEQYRKKYEQ